MAIAAFVVSVLALVAGGASVRIARQAKDEGRLARLDQLAPSVVVSDASGIGKRFHVGPYSHHNETGAPPVLPVDRQLVWPADSEDRVLFGAYIEVRNEGTRTVVIQIDDAWLVNHCQGRDFIGWTLEPDGSMPSSRVPHGRLEVAPGATQPLIIRSGPTLAEWREKREVTEIAIPISASTSPDGPQDRWLLRMRGQILASIPSDESHFRALPHTPPIVELDALGRAYKGTAKSTKRWWKFGSGR